MDLEVRVDVSGVFCGQSPISTASEPISALPCSPLCINTQAVTQKNN